MCVYASVGAAELVSKSQNCRDKHLSLAAVAADVVKQIKATLRNI
jgi:hypothetical protein